jgi:hypothetical protein
MPLVHITEKNLLRKGYSIYWADFEDLQDKRDTSFLSKQIKFLKVSEKRFTLVFEPVGTFLQIIDPSKGHLKFGDPSLI